jgi:hypothetical protein
MKILLSLKVSQSKVSHLSVGMGGGGVGWGVGREGAVGERASEAIILQC